MHYAHRGLRVFWVLAAGLLLAGCGFHLRQAPSLPPGMQSVHVQVSGSPQLASQLRQRLVEAGATLADQTAPGVAELQVSAAFGSRALSVGNYAKVREFDVKLRASVTALDSAGKPLLNDEPIEMRREFTYDRSQALGTATRQTQVRQSLARDMAQAILRRLQGA